MNGSRLENLLLLISSGCYICSYCPIKQKHPKPTIELPGPYTTKPKNTGENVKWTWVGNVGMLHDLGLVRNS